MELLWTQQDYLIVHGESCLRCSRVTGQLLASDASAVAQQSDLECLGVVHGVIGRVSFTAGGSSYLLLIKEQQLVDMHYLNGGPIYKIRKVVALPLVTPETDEQRENVSRIMSDLQLPACAKHHHSYQQNRTDAENGDRSSRFAMPAFQLMQRGQQKMAKATKDSLKFLSTKISAKTTSQSDEAKNQRMRIDRRLLTDLLRMLNDTESFFYSPNADLTNSLQRLCAAKDSESKCDKLVWENFDNRFFWNSHMLRDLLEQAQNGDQALANFWIKPVIQGFVGVEKCTIRFEDDLADTSFEFGLMLISRRSVHRAGTRYIKRGIDDNGDCANYVETEQILLVDRHAIAFTQVRGSVPVYWSQPGYKYRPAPRLDRSRTDSVQACEKHFRGEFERYKQVLVVNLVEQVGREKVLSDAYVDHVLELDEERVQYAAFDFHEHCRGLRFDNVNILVGALEESLMKQRFCWIDKDVVNCEQEGVCRVNCVDCLDRTNVVQAAIARNMLEFQLRKFGLLTPERSLPETCLLAFQLLWAANGDAISRQYAGTAALKGDFTRTGQRNLAGVVKDGYNSANRYYLCHMKDARRQAVIDAMLGKWTLDNAQLASVLMEQQPKEEAAVNHSWISEKDEQLRLLVRDCERLVVPDNETLLGGWALINSDPGTGDETEDDMDTCVMLTRCAYYVADYDEELDKFVDVERVALDQVRKMEIGPMTVSSILGVPKTKAACFRVYYQPDEQQLQQQQQQAGEYFHVWRSGTTRLFNNLAIPIKSAEEADEYITAISEQFRVALELGRHLVPIQGMTKLERKRSKIPASKLAQRRQPLLNTAFASSLSSISNGARLFGNRFSAALSNSTTQGIKFFRLGSARHRKTDLTVPGIALTDCKSELKSQKIYSEAAYRPSTGLLFGKMSSSVDKSRVLQGVRTLARSNTDGAIANHSRSSKGNAAEYGSVTAVAINVEKSPATTEASSPGIELPINRTASSKDLQQFSNTLELPPSNGIKTSQSEVSFKPLQTGDNQSAGLMSTVSNSALDNVEKNTMLRLPTFFRKKNADDNTAASNDKAKWSQFHDRLVKSRSKFILL